MEGSEMHDKHEPDPRFIESLEGQLSRELRRRSREGANHQKGYRLLKIAALMLGSVALGAAAMGASQQLGESWRRELLEARLEVELRLAQQRLQVQLESVGLTREQVEMGVRSDRDLMYFELKIAQAESDARLKELELEEVRSSGREPSGKLSAPLVDGRDFVTEKIHVQMESAQRHLDVVRYDRELTRQRAEAGVASGSEVQARDLVTTEAELQLESFVEQLALRQAYLNEEISAVEAELKSLEAEAQNRIVLLERRKLHFEMELERLRSAIDAGFVRAAAEAEMRTQLAGIDAEIQLAQLELQIVRRELERRAQH
jgi:hypothetical protein